jgi:hypothetical protein
MQVRIDICLNKAACYKRLRRNADDTRSVVLECTEALELRSSNVRALYRRAEAYMELGDLERAAIDIKQALGVEPDHVPLKSLRARLREQQKQADAHDEGLFKTMIRKHAAGVGNDAGSASSAANARDAEAWPAAAADARAGDAAASSGAGASDRCDGAAVPPAQDGALRGPADPAGVPAANSGHTGADSAGSAALLAAAAEAVAAGCGGGSIRGFCDGSIGVRGGWEGSEADGEIGDGEPGATAAGAVTAVRAVDDETDGEQEEDGLDAGEGSTASSAGAPGLAATSEDGDGLGAPTGHAPLAHDARQRWGFVGTLKRRAGALSRAISARSGTLRQASICAAAVGASLGLAALGVFQFGARGQVSGRGQTGPGEGGAEAVEFRDMDDMLQRGMGPLYGPDLPPVMGPPPPPPIGPEKPPSLH